MSNVTKIAIFADVNLNVIDGSSVWVRNIAKLCQQLPNTAIHIYSKAPISRRELVADLIAENATQIISPSAAVGVLPLAKLVSRLAGEDAVQQYDAIIVRGFNAAEQFAADTSLQGRLWLYLTDIPQSISALDEDTANRLQQLGISSRYFLCQTEELRHFLETGAGISGRKLLLLPPLVSGDAFVSNETPATSGNNTMRLVYSGKFAHLWGLHEQLDVFEQLRRDGLDVEFHIVGDKFHNVPENPAFAADLRDRFQNTPGVFWHGGLPQSAVFELLKQCTVGMSLRDPYLNTSLELSTKLLEYGAANLPTIVNPTLQHKQLLGDDYPLFANSTQDAYDSLKAAIEDPGLLETAGNRLRQLAEKHTFSQFKSIWERYIHRAVRAAKSGNSSTRRKKVVLAGHDLKFCKELIEYLEAHKDIELRIDKWQSLRDHDSERSLELLKWADIVICEWCAGNAVWYSENIDPEKQKLFIRFHRFEINTEFPEKVNMVNVRKVIFVGQHILDDASRKFKWDTTKLTVIANFVDTLVYDRPKFPGSRFNLGMIGYVPMLKRLDRAIDILEALLESDDRYCLFVKGKHPWQYPWIWRREEEKGHYDQIFERIRTDARLRDRVVFDGFGDDIPAWLRKIGWVMSVSEIESFHMAAAEGMASGALPVFLERDGVQAIFPGQLILPEPRDAAREILALQQSPKMLYEKQIEAKKNVEIYSQETVSTVYDTLFE